MAARVYGASNALSQHSQTLARVRVSKSHLPQPAASFWVLAEFGVDIRIVRFAVSRTRARAVAAIARPLQTHSTTVLAPGLAPRRPPLLRPPVATPYRHNPDPLRRPSLADLRRQPTTLAITATLGRTEPACHVGVCASGIGSADAVPVFRTRNGNLASIVCQRKGSALLA